MISVIMPTYNRPQFLGRALESVLGQNYDGEIEIIVVDDGSEPPVEISREDPRVRLIRQEHAGVGAARAKGLDLARGDFIAYCDDDDEWTSNHLTALLGYLEDNREVSLVYGDSRRVVPGSEPWDEPAPDFDGVLLSYTPYISATDVLHRAQAAKEAGGFDSRLQLFPDWDLWLRLARTELIRRLPGVISIHHWEPDSLSSRWNDEWRLVYARHQEWVKAKGWAAGHFIDSKSAEPSAFDPATWTTSRRELIWHSLLWEHAGYGNHARNLLAAIERAGVDVTIAPTFNQPTKRFEHLYKPLDHWGRFGFYFYYFLRPSALPADRVINYSMWESTRVPEDHIDEINRIAELQYVPCKQNFDSFLESGLKVPIRVLHGGVDPERWPVLERSPKDVFTFGTFGDLSLRKGLDVLVKAFEDEFRMGEPVKLLLKSTAKPRGNFQISDDRVRLVTEILNPTELLRVLTDMDALVMPSRGEGFGLCGLEAMSTGLPLIATNWGGPADYMDDEYAYPLDYRLVDTNAAESNSTIYHGRWAEPDYEHLRHLMRWVFEHPDEAARKGSIAAKITRESWSWDIPAAQLISDLDEIA